MVQLQQLFCLSAIPLLLPGLITLIRKNFNVHQIASYLDMNFECAPLTSLDRELLMCSACMVTVPFLEYLWRTPAIPSANIVVGTALLLLASFLYIRARADLGANYTATTSPSASHHLVRAGLYKYIRHPIYLRILLIHMGLSIMWGSVLGCITMAFTCYIVRKRISIEESNLQNVDEEYIRYMRQTKRLVPFIW